MITFCTFVKQKICKEKDLYKCTESERFVKQVHKA
jgi:hypothetical protein